MILWDCQACGARGDVDCAHQIPKVHKRHIDTLSRWVQKSPAEALKRWRKAVRRWESAPDFIEAVDSLVLDPETGEVQ